MKRMRVLVSFAICSALLVARVEAGQASSSEKLTADTPRKTARGSTFTAPSEWTLTINGPAIVMQPPDGQTTWVGVVEPSNPEPAAAVTAAWATVRPGVTRTPKLVTPKPGRDGWEAEQTFDYETSPNERRIVFATARRHGTGWTVFVLDADQAVFEKRVSQVILVSQSLRPAGYVEETFSGRRSLPLDTARIKQLTTFVESAMQELGIPGVGLSIFDGGKVVFEGGFGVRELGKPEKVDADTVFQIASNTKALTTLLLARLVDEHKFEWDTPVTRVYPAFKLGDANTTAAVLVRHLVCACTGLPRQDFEWLFEFKQGTPATVMDTLGQMQPTTKFGELFQYSNLMAAAAGFVAGHALYPEKELGAAYDEAMRTRIFEPLGMKTATFDIAHVLKMNHASPHGPDPDGKMMLASMDLNYSIVPARPAGAGWVSARDLMRYVQLELARGKLLDGTQLVSEKNLLTRRDKQVAVGETAHYGMGLFVDSKWGVTVVRHGGSMVGYKSDMLMLPEHGVGAVVLTNGDNGYLIFNAFSRRLLEVLFDGKPEAVENFAAAVKEWKAGVAKERERLMIPADRQPAAALAASYHNPVLGDLIVRSSGPDTTFDLGEWHSRVASRKNDDGTLSFRTIDPGEDGFDFVVTGKTLVLRDLQHEYVFTPR